MNNKKPRDPLYPRGFEETREFKKNKFLIIIQNQIKKMMN